MQSSRFGILAAGFWFCYISSGMLLLFVMLPLIWGFPKIGDPDIVP